MSSRRDAELRVIEEARPYARGRTKLQHALAALDAAPEEIGYKDLCPCHDLGQEFAECECNAALAQEGSDGDE